MIRLDSGICDSVVGDIHYDCFVGVVENTVEIVHPNFDDAADAGADTDDGKKYVEN